MENIFNIPKSNSLRFVNRNKLKNVQTFDNRLMCELDYAKTLPYYYVQQFEQNDPLWFQFRTTYESFTINLVNKNGTRYGLNSFTTLVNIDESGRNYFNTSINISSLIGLYFIEILAVSTGRPTNTFISEPFNISEKVNDSIWIEWAGNSFSYDDQMEWLNYVQGMRVIGRDRDFVTEQNKVIYNNSDYAPVNLKSKPLRKLQLDFDKIPFWIAEKINIGLSHDDFYVNGVKYNTDELLEAEKLGDSMLMKATILLQQTNFEDGIDEELTGDIPEIEPILRTTGLEIRGTGLTDRKIN